MHTVTGLAGLLPEDEYKAALVESVVQQFCTIPAVAAMRAVPSIARLHSMMLSACAIGVPLQFSRSSISISGENTFSLRVVHFPKLGTRCSAFAMRQGLRLQRNSLS